MAKLVADIPATSLVGYYYPIDFFNQSEAYMKRWASTVVLDIIRIVDKAGGDNPWSQGRQNSIQKQVRNFLGTQLTKEGKLPSSGVLAKIEKWLSIAVESAFSAGVGSAGDELSLIGIESFYKLSRSHFSALIFDTFNSVAQAVQETERDLGRRLNEWRYNTLRATSKAATLQGMLEGKSFFTTGKELATRLRTEGIMGFVAKDGKRWALETYAPMVVRTKLKETHSAGFLDHYMSIPDSKLDKLVEIANTPYTDHAGPKDPCWKYQQQRYWALNQTAASKSGLPLLRQAPPWHPNCEHVLRAYIPDESNRDSSRLEAVSQRHGVIRERVRAGEITETAANRLLLRGLGALTRAGASISM